MWNITHFFYICHCKILAVTKFAESDESVQENIYTFYRIDILCKIYVTLNVWSLFVISVYSVGGHY